MGDNIQLFTACFSNNLFNSLGNLFGAVIYRCSRFVITVVNFCAVCNKLCRHSAPIIEICAVTKKHTMHKQYRVFCFANFLAVSAFVKLGFVNFKINLAHSYFYNYAKANKICNRNKSAQQADYPMLYAKLNR